MKRFYFAPYCLALIIGNCWAATTLGGMTDRMKGSLRGALGANMVVAGITKFAIEVPLWLWIFAALSLFAGLAAFFRRLPVSVVLHLFLVLAVLDCIALFGFALGLWDHVYGMYEWVGAENAH